MDKEKPLLGANGAVGLIVRPTDRDHKILAVVAEVGPQEEGPHPAIGTQVAIVLPDWHAVHGLVTSLLRYAVDLYGPPTGAVIAEGVIVEVAVASDEDDEDQPTRH